MTPVNLGPMTMTRGRCKRCVWEFDLVAPPMPVTEAAKACREKCCPMGGTGSGEVMVCTSRALTAEELAHKQKVTA